jgi:tRNA-specific 2-thiouridylase
MTTNKYDIKLLPPSSMPWKPREKPGRQIAVLMSGGVDSSTTAHILKEAGWDVLGITMKIPVSCGTNARGCCGADGAFVCNELDIPHYFVDVTEAFQRFIIEPFRQSYERGETPNPCVDCNALLKFSLVWDLLQETLDINYLATGHYARVVKTAGQVRLSRAEDKDKDQSYFLYGIAAKKLPNLVLPLGELTKKDVRSIASQLNLSAAEKPESMELCFSREGDYRTALTDNKANQDGDITDMQGNKIGTHKGIANYTLGQRKGIGFAGGRPLYVGRIDAQTNTIALGTKDEVSYRIIRANQINTLIPEELVMGKKIYGKIRSYSEPSGCSVIEVSDGDMTVEFSESQFAPCPGQKLVLYNSEGHIIAGGTIASGRT